MTGNINGGSPPSRRALPDASQTLDQPLTQIAEAAPYESRSAVPLALTPKTPQPPSSLRAVHPERSVVGGAPLALQPECLNVGDPSLNRATKCENASGTAAGKELLDMPNEILDLIIRRRLEKTRSLNPKLVNKVFAELRLVNTVFAEQVPKAVEHLLVTSPEQLAAIRLKWDLKVFSALKSIDVIGDLSNIDPAQLPEHITKLSLESNDVNGHVPQAWLERISQLTQLTSLDLCGCYMGTGNTKYLADLQMLQTLNLAFCNTGPDDIAHLVKCEGLSKLDLYFTEVGEAGAKCLSQLRNLSELELHNGNIGDGGVQELRLEGLTKLTKLGLSVNQIGDVGAQVLEAAVSDLPELIEIDLRNNNISRDFLKKLITRLADKGVNVIA